MVHEFLSSLVDAVNVSVDVNAITVGPVVWLVDIEFVKTLTDLNLVNVFGDVDHLSGVLHEATVLSFRCFVGTKSTPLGWVQISSLEVRLAAHQR